MSYQKEKTNKSYRAIGNFAALKTAIMNGEVNIVKSLVANHSFQELEKSYLLDLARLRNNDEIVNLLKAVPLTK